MRSGAQITQQRAVQSGPVWAAQLFLLSLLVPFFLPVGPVLLMPHRIVIIALFVPFFLRLFVFRSAGPVLLADWLLFCSALWAGIALVVNHPIGLIVEPFGIHMIEFFGAYLLARVAIRSAADFKRMVWTFFCLVAFLFPFALAESITRRPIMLDLLPGTSVSPVDAGVRLGLRRAQTVFAHPILFGAFVSTGLGLFWYALRPKGLRYVAAPLAVASTVLSLSTGALIAIVFQSIFIGWEMILKSLKKRWTLFAILAVVAYILVDLLSNRTPFHVLVTYATFYQGSAYNRILIWQFGTENVWNNPIFGLGLNDWSRPSWMSGSVDNFWLLLAMRYGFPAIGMILAALVLILRRVSLVDIQTPEDRLCRAGYLVAFGGLFIAGGTVHYWHAMMAFVMFIFGSGLWCVTGGVQSEESSPSETDPFPERRSSYTRQPVGGGAIARESATVLPRRPLRVPQGRSSAAAKGTFRRNSG